MKTFLGFITGLLSGFILGIYGMAMLSIVSDGVKDEIVKQNEKVNIHW